jgi:hypothetical protein
MKRLAAVVVLMFVAVIATGAQTISPLNAEFGKKADSTFTITNNKLQPISATVRSFSFSMDATGGMVVRPLDAGVHVQLDSSSARIDAKQSHIFSYRVTCDKLPCNVTFMASTLGHTDRGMAVARSLEHTIYICQKHKGCRTSILASYHFKP